MSNLGWILILVLCGPLGCASSDDGPAQPSSCDPAQRGGTYRLKMTTQSGNCGDVPESIVSFAPTDPLADGCTFITPDRYSEGNCKLERSFECVAQIDDPAAYGGKSTRTTRTVGFSRQMTADGSRIEGVMTTSVSGTSAGPCTGTYGLSAVRQ